MTPSLTILPFLSRTLLFLTFVTINPGLSVRWLVTIGLLPSGGVLHLLLLISGVSSRVRRCHGWFLGSLTRFPGVSMLRKFLPPGLCISTWRKIWLDRITSGSEKRKSPLRLRFFCGSFFRTPFLLEIISKSDSGKDPLYALSMRRMRPCATCFSNVRMLE